MEIISYFKKLDLNKVLVVAGVAAGAFLIAFFLWWQWGQQGKLSFLDWLGFNTIGIKNEGQSASRRIASLTGLTCDNYSKRPIAVMMASDPIARPLSGIGQADIVIEMPVTPNGITRMMAIFQCDKPKEIGSVRSAREDFLTLVAGFGALYVHWGGEREVLNKLNNGISDNIDAMKYEGTVFYRKNSVPKPHNGFTTIELLEDKAEDLGYDSSDTFVGYLRTEEKTERTLTNIVSAVSVDYENSYKVEWTYDEGTNSYKRKRGGKAEIDKNTSEQVETNIIVLMQTISKVLNMDYIRVNTTGEGDAEFYQNGIKTSGVWKNPAKSGDRGAGALKFYDTAGQEMKFVPGKMWIEIVTN